jgi:hypothetical protein
LPICCCFLLGCFSRSFLLRSKRGDNFLIFVNICSFWYLTISRPVLYLFLTQICSVSFLIIVCKPCTDRRHHRGIYGVHIIMGDDMRALSQSGQPRRIACFVHAGVRGWHNMREYSMIIIGRQIASKLWQIHGTIYWHEIFVVSWHLY